MEFYNPDSTPHLISVSDSMSEEFISMITDNMSELGYYPVEDSATSVTTDSFTTTTTTYAFDESNEVYVRTPVVAYVTVQFNPEAFLANVECLDSNDTACGIVANLMEDQDFFKWFMFKHAYTRGETNSEALVDAFGDRDTVETAILASA